MQDVVYLNGDFIPRSKAYIHVDDRGFYFGDGVYEVVKYYRGKPFCFGEHMDRLRKSLDAVRITKVNIDALEYTCTRLIYLNDLHGTYSAVYIQITRGVAPRTHRFPGTDTVPTIYAGAFPMPFPENDAVKGISVTTADDIRWKRCNIKAITLLPNTLAFNEAYEKGAQECFYVRDGVFTECTHSNIMAVRNNIVFTHHEGNLILSGITRKVIIQICRELNIEVREEPVKVSEMAGYSEFFITGTGSEILPVIAIDGQTVGAGVPGNITRTLQRAFYNMTYLQLAGEKIETSMSK